MESHHTAATTTAAASSTTKHLPLFAELDDDGLFEQVAHRFKRVLHQKGEVVAKEGEPQPAMFVVESGKVRRTKGGLLVDVLGPGEYTGLLHLLTQDPCFATLECQEETALLILSAKEFRELFDLKESSLAAKLLVVFSKKLRKDSKLLRRTDTDNRFRVIFFDFKPYERDPFTRANNLSGSEKYRFNFCPERLNERTVSQASDHDAVCLFVNDCADAKVVELLANMNIKLIAMRCAGYNNVDLNACKVHGIQVVRVPAYSPYAVAEYAMGLIMTLNRKLHKAYNRTREGNFALQGLLGFDIHGKTVGVVGTGKIGVCLIDILVGFGCKILCHDVYQNSAVKAKPNTKYVDLDEIFASSDIISLHVPLLESTRHMINSESIAKMKKGVMLINTSRGALIETSALINGLKSGRIGSAGLDVYEEEEAYFFEDHSAEVISDAVLARLLTFPNVLVTGHQAFFTFEALNNIAETTLNNIDAFVDGKVGDDHPNRAKAEYS